MTKYLILLLFLAASFKGPAQNADIDLLRDINLHRNRSLNGTMIAITNFDYPVSIAIPVTELIVGYVHHDKKTMVYGIQTVAGFAINTIFTEGLKYAVHRARPFVTYPDIQPYQSYTDYSFPSGHSSFAFCAATSLSICYPRWYIVAPAYLWASAVGYSRLFLGVHYPSDVLAGAIIGAGSSWLAYKGNKWIAHAKKRNSQEHR